MLELDINVPVAGGVMKITGDNPQDIIKQASFWLGMPSTCPLCQSPVVLVYRNPKEFEYFGLRCMGPVRHEKMFGIHKSDKGLFDYDQRTFTNARDDSELGAAEEEVSTDPPTENTTGGQCPHCHAPAGKMHVKGCKANSDPKQSAASPAQPPNSAQADNHPPETVSAPKTDPGAKQEASTPAANPVKEAMSKFVAQCSALGIDFLKLPVPGKTAFVMNLLDLNACPAPVTKENWETCEGVLKNYHVSCEIGNVNLDLQALDVILCGANDLIPGCGKQFWEFTGSEYEKAAAFAASGFGM